ncbi:hypothetical protein VC83_07413 [Pseudogymnoascus destructans]|uniref:BRCA1-associated protein n=1 Tax=Pseudogymnoascus destructans TaxID=655981 RepID=A0A177A1T4_9PEZI|nr:uncharacterized protein VC83_07413 [Pseudogymnoascus destructans]OAF56118.2 hypothetical protein VC83_07413 [Pseudogymnoascus destructans]
MRALRHYLQFRPCHKMTLQKDLPRHPTSDNPNCILQHPVRLPHLPSPTINFHANTPITGICRYHHPPDNYAMTNRAYFYHLRFELFPKPYTGFVDKTAPDVDGETRLPATLVSFSDSLPNHFKLPVAGDNNHRTTTLEATNETTRHSTIDDVTDALNTPPPGRHGSIIDCGPRRADIHRDSPRHDLAPAPLSRRCAEEAARDWRFGRVRASSIQMGEMEGGGSGAKSQGARARVEEVRLRGRDFWGGGGGGGGEGREGVVEGDEGLDTTMLCIPAVPSYMTASDFLGWVGEKTRELVSHFRMVMTGRMNRYMMLMKFRDGAEARKWRREWDGKVFNGMEPENCHVMFIKSIHYDTLPFSNQTDATASFPDMSLDPFTPTSPLALKPLPPPTASLVELPTCPVCLERMDETTGLLTILCQHVFHCACLQKWRGSGCPVCRHVQPANSLSTPFGFTAATHDLNLCQVCACPEDLWICLICGNVGCGRYNGGHAKGHWKETAHNYSLETTTQHVWDYAEDVWVHRLLQTKGDGKIVELPGSSRAVLGGGNNRDGGGGQQDLEMVPREKMEKIGIEYGHMLATQLDSQRMYFEEVVAKAVDKAAGSVRDAERAARAVEEVRGQLEVLEREHREMREEVIPGLQRDRDRMAAKAEKAGELARSMTKAFHEEKQVGRGLMDRVGHLNEALERVRREVKEVRDENVDLKEQNRDLGFFISSQEKVRGLEGSWGRRLGRGR